MPLRPAIDCLSARSRHPDIRADVGYLTDHGQGESRPRTGSCGMLGDEPLTFHRGDPGSLLMHWVPLSKPQELWADRQDCDGDRSLENSGLSPR